MAKRALLVVSFGTTFEDTRKKTIEKCEQDLQNAFSDYAFFRAYTSQMIINKLATRDQLIIPNPSQALTQIYKAGYTEVLIQTLHIICGNEYHKLLKDIKNFKSKFHILSLGRPLLTTIEDYKQVVTATLAYLPSLKDKEALVFMGHGTSHPNFSAYCALEYMFQQTNSNIYIGTVEGYPTITEVLPKLLKNKTQVAYLIPFMLVAGDHALHDMSGCEPNTWQNILLNHHIKPSIRLHGLGENPQIRQLFISHAKEAL
ncbi:MAG: sirohydrochlorin cobaltochelatase [Niameybacter sp.]|uniref:sirohydrochlorin cobaltochelatase n=1 Tax=Niameybacter sp. TaxID=2033640 RepID=UPI002FC681A5